MGVSISKGTDEMTPFAAKDFTGKLVLVYVKGAPRAIQDGIVLEFPEFVNVGERLFLHGRIPELAGDDWIYNLQQGVAWQDVICYMLFDSREDYIARMSRAKGSIWRRLTRKKD